MALLSINCKGNLVDLRIAKVMGIINLSPDSFYANSRYLREDEILRKVEHMMTAGATFLDFGGQSTRPGAMQIEAEAELKRIEWGVEAVLKHFPEAILSIDTYYASVAQAALEMGVAMVNDISSGLLDKQMLEVVARYQVPYVLMHMQGNPGNMQLKPQYGNVVKEVAHFLSERIALARKQKINDLILDVGFGFGKSISHNYQLLAHLDYFSSFELPLLVGISRKSMIYKPLEGNPEKALNGTSALHMLALRSGASILRVHDVDEAVECIKLFQLYDEGYHSLQ